MLQHRERAEGNAEAVRSFKKEPLIERLAKRVATKVAALAVVFASCTYEPFVGLQETDVGSDVQDGGSINEGGSGGVDSGTGGMSDGGAMDSGSGGFDSGSGGSDSGSGGLSDGGIMGDAGVVDGGAAEDSGVAADAGGGGTDAGEAGMDSGTGGTDAGTTDAGTGGDGGTMSDAGSDGGTMDGGTDGGMGCPVASTGTFNGTINEPTPETVGGYVFDFVTENGGGDAVFNISCGGMSVSMGLACPEDVETVVLDVPSNKRLRITPNAVNALAVQVSITVENI